MEKGKLRLKGKSRFIKIPGKKIFFKKEMPQIGNEYNNMDCEFEGDPVTKIIVDKIEFAVDLNAVEERNEKRKIQKEQEEELQNMLRQQANGPDSFSLIHSRVPSDTRQCMIRSGDNFSLKLNQFARFDYKDNKREEKHFIFFNSRPIKTKGPETRSIVPKIKIEPNFGNLFESPTQLSSRLNSSAKSIFPEAGELLELEFEPEWRFVTGLGGPGVYETGITLHHVYGIPYIPASSIKGILRTWVTYTWFNNNEGKAIQDKDFCHVFGCPAAIRTNNVKYDSCFQVATQGKISFFDSFPLSKPNVEPDIMNPHYSEWYSEKPGAGPVDTDNPTPIFFLTVKDTSFRFLIGSKKYNLESHAFWDGKTLSWWLENALSEHGIGAKTGVGYGYMQKVE